MSRTRAAGACADGRNWWFGTATSSDARMSVPRVSCMGFVALQDGAPGIRVLPSSHFFGDELRRNRYLRSAQLEDASIVGSLRSNELVHMSLEAQRVVVPQEAHAAQPVRIAAETAIASARAGLVDRTIDAMHSLHAQLIDTEPMRAGDMLVVDRNTLRSMEPAGVPRAHALVGYVPNVEQYNRELFARQCRRRRERGYALAFDGTATAERGMRLVAKEQSSETRRFEGVWNTFWERAINATAIDDVLLWHYVAFGFVVVPDVVRDADVLRGARDDVLRVREQADAYIRTVPLVWSDALDRIRATPLVFGTLASITRHTLDSGIATRAFAHPFSNVQPKYATLWDAPAVCV